MFPLFTSIVLLAITAGLFYIYLVWNFGYWKKRGIKEAKSYPLVGSFPGSFMRQRSIVYDIDDIYKENKQDHNFVGIMYTRVPRLLITSPEYVQKIFVNDFKSFHDNDFSIFLENDAVSGSNPFIVRGEIWKKRRAEISPGLTASRLKCIYSPLQKVCKALTDYLRKQSKMACQDGLEAKDFCRRFTTELVSVTLFGADGGCFSAQPTPVYETIKQVFEELHQFVFYTVIATMMPLIKIIYMVPFFSKRSQTFFLKHLKTAINLRRQSKNDDCADFLKFFLELQDKKNLTLNELTSIAVLFVTDGIETTSAALSHTLLLLARHPEIQEKVRSEIEDAGKLTFEKLSKLSYLEACIYGHSYISAPDNCQQDLHKPYEFVNKDGKKVRIEPDEVVLVPVYSLHHDEDIYENPEEFVPERFLEDAGGISVKKYQDMGAYLGFGNGPRICMGVRFALTQMKAAIVELLMQFTIKVNPKTRTDNYLDELFPMGLLKGGLWLDFEPRNSTLNRM